MGWKTVIGCGQSGNDTAALTFNGGVAGWFYAQVGGAIVTPNWQGTSPDTTLNNGQLTNYGAYTASLMNTQVGGVTNPGQSFLTQLSIGQTPNGTLTQTPNGNQIVTMTTGFSTGHIFNDISNTDAVPAGTKVALGQGWASGTGTGQCVFASFFWQADMPGGVSVPWVNQGVFSVGTRFHNNLSSWFYLGVHGAGQALQPVGQIQSSLPAAGVWSDIQININQATSATAGEGHLTGYITSTWNDPNTTYPFGSNQIVRIPNNNNGGGGGVVAADTSHTDSVPGNNAKYITYALNVEGNNISDSNPGFNNPLYWNAFGSTFTSAQPNVTPLFAVGDTPSHGAGADSRTQMGYSKYRPGSNAAINSNPSEGPAQYPVAGTFSGFNGVTNTANASSQCQSLISNAAGNQFCTIGAASGVNADPSHTDASPANSTFMGHYDTNFNATDTVSGHAVAFRTADGTGAFSFGLG